MYLSDFQPSYPLILTLSHLLQQPELYARLGDERLHSERKQEGRRVKSNNNAVLVIFAQLEVRLI